MWLVMSSNYFLSLLPEELCWESTNAQAYWDSGSLQEQANEEQDNPATDLSSQWLSSLAWKKH